MNAEAEIAVMHIQAKEHHRKCPQSPRGRREAWSGFSLRASRRTQPCLHLDLRFLALTTLFFLSYQVCNDFFQQPQELIHSKMCQGPTGAWCGLMFLLQVTAGATRKRAEPGLPVEMLSS